MKIDKIKNILILLFLLVGINLYAEDGTDYPTTSLRFQMYNFAGLKNKSFSETATGFAGGITLMMQKEFFVPYVAVTIGGQSAKQSFLDGANSVNSTYLYQFGGGELGLYLFPFGRKPKGLNIYVNGAGLGGYHSLALNSSTTLTTIPHSDQNFSTGYKGNVGFEWILQNKSKRTKWTIYSEVGFKKESVTLFNQNFSLDSLNYSLGIGW